jgi:hypothetical protein
MNIVEGENLLFAREERRYHSGNQRDIFIYVVSLATCEATKPSAERTVIFGQVTSAQFCEWFTKTTGLDGDRLRYENDRDWCPGEVNETKPTGSSFGESLRHSQERRKQK